MTLEVETTQTTLRKQRQRATKKSDLRKTKTLSPLRVTIEERELIYAAADQKNKTVSSFVLDTVLCASKKIINSNRGDLTDL